MRLIKILVLCLMSSSVYALDAKMPGMAENSVGFAQEGSCSACHTDQTKAWQHSDHAKAMQKANKDTVLGDFNNQHFKDGKNTATFFTKEGKYYVNTEGSDGKKKDFKISYTFGVEPLQQYLIAQPGGRLQSLTIAWDSRTKEKGGQRWFSLYPGKKFATTDALHWTGRYQNWNAMCAECHSTSLSANYNAKKDTFSTTWHEQNVGCQSCHGPSQSHVNWAKKHNKTASTSADVNKTNEKKMTAKEMGLPIDMGSLKGPELVNQCAVCHSRRQSLGKRIQPEKPLLNNSLPVTLRQGMYHSDGQIEGEVYVYGSFAQSKMYHAGVDCTDCHNVHTTKVILKNNGLCTRCHNENPPKRFPTLTAKSYDSEQHYHHKKGSAGSQCVNCHMPTQTYMQIDARRDHSLRIPRPDLDKETNSPDACTACHTDKKPEWATGAIDKWFKSPKRPEHYGQILQKGRNNIQGSSEQLTTLIKDLSRPAIVRATALEQLIDTGAPHITTVEQALNDKDPLVRAYAASGVSSLTPVDRVKKLLPLLKDKNQAVRDEALRALAGIPDTAIPDKELDTFKKAMTAYEKRLRANASLPGNRLNLAVFLEHDGRKLEAMEQYRIALKMDPYFSPARVNLVTLANSSMQPNVAEKTLREGLALKDMPATDHANLAYLFALFLVEHKKSDEALKWLEVANKGLPDNQRIRYNYGLLLARLRHPDQAKKVLAEGLTGKPKDADLLYALIFLSSSTGDVKGVATYLRLMEKNAPNDPRLESLRQHLEQSK